MNKNMKELIHIIEDYIVHNENTQIIIKNIFFYYRTDVEYIKFRERKFE